MDDKKFSVFTMVDENGNEIDGEDLGLLLYLGGTVCDDYFNNTAADAICKTMNYTSAIIWTTNEDFGSLQTNYRITLDNVRCSSSEWESCTFKKWHNCAHDEDVFLSCRKKDSGKFLTTLVHSINSILPARSYASMY